MDYLKILQTYTKPAQELLGQVKEALIPKALRSFGKSLEKSHFESVVAPLWAGLSAGSSTFWTQLGDSTPTSEFEALKALLTQARQKQSRDQWQEAAALYEEAEAFLESEALMPHAIRNEYSSYIAEGFAGLAEPLGLEEKSLEKIEVVRADFENRLPQDEIEAETLRYFQDRLEGHQTRLKFLVESKAKRLESDLAKMQELGFEELVLDRDRGAHFFQKEKLFLEIDGRGQKTFFVDYQTRFDASQGMKLGQKYSPSFSLVTLSASGQADESPLSFLYESPWSQHEEIQQTPIRAEEFAGKNGDQQLREAGFTLWAQGEARNYYRLYFNDRGTPYRLIAITEDGDLKRILKSNPESLGSHQRIVGYQEAQIVRNFPRDAALLFQNDQLSFEWIPSDFGGSIANPVKLSSAQSLSPQNIGLPPLSPMREASGFVVGGQNSSAVIRGLSSLGAIAVDELEMRMGAGADFPGFAQAQETSRAGQPLSGGDNYLGREERLLEVMSEDNDFVLVRGFTHQELASHLHYVVRIAMLQIVSQKAFLQEGGGEFEYLGQRFEVSWQGYQSHEISPFVDGTGSNIDLTLKNLSKGKTIQFSILLPDMIARYGFYEGKMTSYRLDPKDVLEVFGLG